MALLHIRREFVFANAHYLLIAHAAIVEGLRQRRLSRVSYMCLLSVLGCLFNAAVSLGLVSTSAMAL